jgi:hypothetical protein
MGRLAFISDTVSFALRARKAIPSRKVRGALVVLASVSAPATAAPGADFDLAQWTLQLPVALNGSVEQIKGDKLEAGYTSQYFQSGADGSMVFWCPVNGGTTPNTKYPRSELRENAPGGDWSLDGDHELRASCKVLVTPSTGRVIIGQIHGHADESEILKLIWEGGKVSAAVEPTRAGESLLPLGTYKIGDSLVYSIRMRAGKLEVKVGANGASKSVQFDYTAATWKTDTYYFKAGAYAQDDAGPASEGAKVAFYSLQVLPAPVSLVRVSEGSGSGNGKSGTPEWRATGWRMGGWDRGESRFDARGRAAP